MNKYSKPTLQKLENILHELEYSVRYEKGTFNSGYCLVENKKVVVINRFYETDGRVMVLLEILDKILDDDSLLAEKSRTFYRNLLKNHHETLKPGT